MDFDAIVIGSGFGGAVTACRLAQAGYRVLVLERGRRWTHDRTDPSGNAYPRPGDPIDKWLWDPNRPDKRHGWIDFRTFPNMSVIQGAGVGGGSLIYANVSVEAPQSAFADGWPAGFDWYQELKPRYDRVKAFMNVVPVPPTQWSGRTLLMKEAAEALGQGARFRPAEVAITFGQTALDWKLEPVRPDAPTFAVNQHGVQQGSCYHCGMCDIGCDVNARNTLDTNYLPVAERNGATIRPLTLVSHVEHVPGRGGDAAYYRVHHSGVVDGKPAATTARIVIVAAGSLGSTELLLRSRDLAGTLPAVSPFLGRNWCSNGDFLTPAYYPKRSLYPATGITISSCIDFHDASRGGHRFWIQDGGFPDLLARCLEGMGTSAPKWLKALTIVDVLRTFLHRANPANHVMPWFAQGVDVADGVMRLRRRFGCIGPWKLHLDWKLARSKPLFDEILKTHVELSKATGGDPEPPLSYTLAGSLITPHPLGGCNMGNAAADGVVDHAGQVFGYPGLYVADGAIIPRAIGVNPSRTIAALAERIADLIVAGRGGVQATTSLPATAGAALGLA